MSRMTLYLLPACYALFLWWFTTGAVIIVYGRQPRTIRRWFIGATVVALGAIAGLWVTRSQSSILAVYGAFTCGTVLWGWLMATYYLGLITGVSPANEVQRSSDRYRLQRDPIRRFKLALRASLHHELMVLAVAAVLVAVTWDAANRWGLWTFLALWSMHVTSKINVFLGVRNFHIEFLPAHLRSIGALLGERPMNAFFPISVVAASTVVLVLFNQALTQEIAPPQVVGQMLVGLMILLGVIELWILVLPLPVTLWGWNLRPLPQDDRPAVEQTGHRPPGTLGVVSEQVSES